MPKSKNAVSKKERRALEVLAARADFDCRRWLEELGNSLNTLIESELNKFFGPTHGMGSKKIDILLQTIRNARAGGCFLGVEDLQEGNSEKLTALLESRRLEKVIDQICVHEGEE